MRPISRLTTWATTLTVAAGAMVALAGSPAAADGGGYWSTSCNAGRACLKLSGGRSGVGGPYWNVVGCGYHTLKDHFEWATAYGNGFDVIYADQRWDRVQPYTPRGLDPNNLVTGVDVLC
ncbi:hypothetical protein ACFV8E_29635 [Streptomyces sp. NPDC059849]|uniref:hypothetical protein n=1 Tax=Streptomyces sp. NPDC059849 TaxID=3346969 RepID=UPI00364F89F6